MKATIINARWRHIPLTLLKLVGGNSNSEFNSDLLKYIKLDLPYNFAKMSYAINRTEQDRSLACKHLSTIAH